MRRRCTAKTKGPGSAQATVIASRFVEEAPGDLVTGQVAPGEAKAADGVSGDRCLLGRLVADPGILHEHDLASLPGVPEPSVVGHRLIGGDSRNARTG